jgi:hypothetical protein
MSIPRGFQTGQSYQNSLASKTSVLPIHFDGQQIWCRMTLAADRIGKYGIF